MTVRNYTKDQAATASMGDQSLIRVQWAGLLNGDTGQPAPWGEWADRTVHFWATNYLTGVVSTLGAGGSMSFEGSNDYDPNTDPTNATWVVLTNQQGTAMTVTTAAGIMQATEATLWVRPHITAGDGTTTANCILVARRLQPMIVGG